MTEVVYYVASSVDGFIATPEGSVDWLAPFEGGPEDYGYAEFYASVDAVLLGRRTFEQALTFGEWPYAGKPTWVFSHAALADAPEGVTVTALEPEQVVAQLESLGVRRAWLVGGGALAGAFQTAGLITEYIVSYVPVILGAGVPLFGASGGVLERLALKSSAAFDAGLLQATYRSDDDD